MPHPARVLPSSYAIVRPRSYHPSAKRPPTGQAGNDTLSARASRAQVPRGMARLTFRNLLRKREAPCASSAPPAPRDSQESVREAPCASSAPSAPSYSQESVREVLEQSQEELPPWTPRCAIEPPHPVVVPDDALSSAEPSPAGPSPAQVSRWGTTQLGGPIEAAVLSATKVGPLPWESGSAKGHTSEREDGGSELPSPVPSPNGVATRPNLAQFCSVCGSLYTAAVCRCSMLAFKHPITRIVSQTGQSSPGGSLTWLTPEAIPSSAPDIPNKQGRTQRALWSTSGEDGAGTDAARRKAAGSGPPSPEVPHVFVSLCDDGLEDELTV